MRRWISASGFLSLLLVMALGAPAVRAQKTPSQPSRPASPEKHQAVAAVDTNAEASDMESTRAEFHRLLDYHPRLVGVLYHDPSLLADLDYIKRNGPDLAGFLEQHPEIAQNPDFFLGDEVGRMHDTELSRRHPMARDFTAELFGYIGPFLIFVILTGAFLWIFRALIENRRWSRMAKVQAEVHTKLLEKFSSAQDLQAYMQTEAGRRFLESAPIPVEPDQKIRLNAPVGRILWSVQVGVILAMGGLGLFSVRAFAPPEGTVPLTILGMLVLMLGLGFVLSAGAAYALSRRLGLLERTAGGSAT